MRVMVMLFFASGPSSRCNAPGDCVSPADTSSVVLSWPLALNSLRPMTRKRVVLSGRVLDLRHQHAQAIHFRSRFSCDRRGAVLITRATRRFGIAADRHALDARQMLIQPLTALRQRLRMRADAHDLLQALHAAHQVLTDAQLDFAADLQRRVQEHVERVVDRAFGGVLDRHHAEVGVPGLHFFEHFADRRQRQRAHRMTEMLEHRLLRERAFRPEERDLERLLLRQARGHDLAEQPHDFFVAQRSFVAFDAPCAAPALRVRACRSRPCSGLRRAWTSRPAARTGALVEQFVDALVDAVDALADRAELAAWRRSALLLRSLAPALACGRLSESCCAFWADDGATLDLGILRSMLQRHNARTVSTPSIFAAVRHRPRHGAVESISV